MISYQAVLAELEKYITAAKVADNEQQFREALAATKALCDVVLQMPASQQKQPFFEKKVDTFSTGQVVREATVYRTTESLPISSSQRLEEEDGANGDSLFDF